MLFDTTERPIEHVKKTQNIRLYVDLMLMAPYLFYLSQKGTVSNTDKVILASIALVTIGYNSKNFVKNL